jgi:hypothetical protein
MVALFRILTFRGAPADFERLGIGHLVFGMVMAWLVGIGRYWDNPRASTLQQLGVGSLVYVFALSAMLFVVGLGLRPPKWSFLHLLTFVSITSVPGVVYAIPVERFLSAEGARTANLWFLGVVATWRVVLYGTYLRRHARMEWFQFFMQLLLPLVLILVALTALNLEHAVFDVMGGLTETTPADSAYAFVTLLTALAVVVSPVLAVCYVALVIQAWRGRPASQAGPPERPEVR